jgi:hypothetical protein
MWNRFMTKAGWRDDRSVRLQQLVVEYDSPLLCQITRKILCEIIRKVTFKRRSVMTMLLSVGTRPVFVGNLGPPLLHEVVSAPRIAVDPDFGALDPISSKGAKILS